MDPLSEMLTLSEDCQVTVYESDLPRSWRRSDMEKEAAAAPEELTGLGYFKVKYYPSLLSVSEGDVPDPANALTLPGDILDQWYMMAWRLNRDWYDVPYTDERRSQKVTFRDGSSVEVWESLNCPSFMIRLYELEIEAVLHPSDDPREQLFRQAFYPKMAGCVKDPIPGALEVFRWPTSESTKWYEAAMALNPDWFTGLTQAGPEAEKQEKKKEKRKRVG